MWSWFLPKLSGTRVVEARKITDYLLDVDHPKGAPKARFFKRFGFDTASPSLLQDALRRHPDANDIVKVTQT